MDVKIKREDEEVKTGLFGGKATVYKAFVSIALDEQEAESLELFLREPANNMHLVYNLITHNPKKGYTFPPPGEKGQFDTEVSSQSRYSELLKNYKEGNPTELKAKAIQLVHRETWIKEITKNLKEMKEMSELYSHAASKTGQDENISI